MTIVHPPSAEENTDTIEALDWAPPCEYSMHDQLGSVGPATLAVWMRPYPRCGHCPRPFFYVCDTCWNVRCSTPGGVYCTVCRASAGPFDTVVRVERI